MRRRTFAPYMAAELQEREINAARHARSCRIYVFFIVYYFYLKVWNEWRLARRHESWNITLKI